MRYALIDNGVVVNVIILANSRIASEFPNAVSCDGKPVNINDTYENGHFYRDGEEVLSTDELLARAEDLLNLLYAGLDPEIG